MEVERPSQTEQYSKESRPNPLGLFHEWMEEASKHPWIERPTAMNLATSQKDGKVSNRVVLLKEADEQGFVFYTNTSSRKANELGENPHGALCFYWMPLDKQVRIEGSLTPVSQHEADAYHQSRPRESQVGAWASKQSSECSEAELRSRYQEYLKTFHGKPVPRPPFWSGYRLSPKRMEFWQAGEHRLHTRWLYSFEAKDWNERWQCQQLYP